MIMPDWLKDGINTMTANRINIIIPPNSSTRTEKLNTLQKVSTNTFKLAKFEEVR